MWKLISSSNPKVGEVFLTKLHDEGGQRNVQELKRGSGKLCWEPDGKMYVYYTPTHYWSDKDF